jgi:hypothetical protein
MAVQDMARIDVAGFYNTIVKLFWEAIRLPFEIWNNTPDEIKLICMVLTGIIFSVIVYITYKTKDDWRFVSP